MNIKQAFGKALRATRRARGLSQESLSEVSGRTYISAVERGVKNPTIQKVDQIASQLDVHPLTLMVLVYALQEGMPEETSVDHLLQQVSTEVRELLAEVQRELILG